MEAYVPVFGILAGGIVSLVSIWLSSKWQDRRQQSAHAADIATRRALFQRETLMDVQEHLQALLRAGGKIMILDERNLLTRGTRSQLGEELSDEHMQHNVQLSKFISRVDDDAIRSEAEDIRSGLNRLSIFSGPIEEQRALMYSTSVRAAELQQTIGAVIRTL